MTHKDPSINHLSSLEGDATVKSTRPKWNEEMFKELALYVGKIINKWCNNETPLEDCVESATKVLQWHIHDDGYQIAKELEQEGFNSDSQLVEELDDVFHEKNSILERHIKQWTIDSKIHLLLPIGTAVKYKDLKQGEVVAEIVSLYPDKSEYGIWWAGLRYEKGKGNRVVKSEDVVEIKTNANV